MKQYDAIVIGSGLGGLECAYILCKRGLNVCVVEKHSGIGGCLQSFNRLGHTLDTGFHYIGGLGEGQILHKIFNYLDLLSLPWRELDRECFDEIIFGDNSYTFINGYNNFADKICSYFPDKSKEIESYISLLKEVGEKVADPLFVDDGQQANPLFSINAYKHLSNILNSKKLLDVISGNSLKMELNKPTLPLYTFTQINSSFIQSAHRLAGGGSQIANQLAKRIKEMGGEVLTNCTATKIVEKNGVASHIEATLKNSSTTDVGENIKLSAQYFISDLAPEQTLNLLKESTTIRNIYRKRISSIEQTFGMFTASIILKPNSIQYLNRNIYNYAEGISPWDVSQDVENGGTPKAILISMQCPENGEFASVMDILTPMSFSTVEKWRETSIGRRGEDYIALKNRYAEHCINLARQVIPNLTESIDKIFCSTPLTYMNYTGAINGTAYGIRKDCDNAFKTLIATKTPLSNLFFTGQNLNLHGVLGVSMTSFLTCQSLLKEKNFASFLRK